MRVAAERNTIPIVLVTPDSLTANRIQSELQFFNSSNDALPILSFPDWETLPYDQFSPYRDIVSERIATLTRLPLLTSGILVVPVTTLMHRVAPREYIDANSLLVSVGDRLEIDRFRYRISSGGYSGVSQVMEHGDFAVRGSLIDIFPMGSELPYRIDLFDEEVESIRVFDPETQRSQQTAESIYILPAREFPLTEEAITRFRSHWRSRFEGNAAACPIYRDVSQGLAPAGIEYYLPLFFPETNTLFDHLPDACVIVVDDDVEQASTGFWDDIRERYEQARHDRERPLLPPHEVFLHPDELWTATKCFPRLSLSTLAQKEFAGATNFAVSAPTQLPIEARAPDPLAVVKRFLAGFNGRVLFVAESNGRRETLLELLSEHALRPVLFDTWSAFRADNAPLGLTVAPLEQGTQLDSPRIAVISETQLFGERAMQRRLRKRAQRDAELIVRNLTELTMGAPVVHEEHGVGRYRGLVTLDVDDVRAEFICIEYAQGDKLYVPVSSLHLISRYTGVDGEHAPLHRLGSAHWQRAKRKAAERAYDVAAELLELNARRAARSGFSYTVDEDAYRAYVQRFPFEETPDQLAAIQAVLEDMQDDKPMDRLVCGDPGFGKTEVAMRAAFVAVQDGKQVAILAPTTLLVQQHYQNFLDRFADWPVRIEQLSRFRSRKEQDSVIQGLATGSVDIVIGTHKLLQDTTRFKRLGLVVIDEEHRFGVRQKEKFKALRAEVDLLTLTATPIPRTLNM
ncbi:MAG: DEAD/DEAH box helicase, partial [Gammaproteobacteria bacterium]|nr:DEAD/DEAH box helicase [Gammaproteobacteria bacterium]